MNARYAVLARKDDEILDEPFDDEQEAVQRKQELEAEGYDVILCHDDEPIYQ